jgi:hypothetical protein
MTIRLWADFLKAVTEGKSWNCVLPPGWDGMKTEDDSRALAISVTFHLLKNK